MSGIFAVDVVIVATFAATVRGAPDAQEKIPPNCQCSTNRARNPEERPSNKRFGPKGKSHVPLFLKSCVRWVPNSCLLARRFRRIEIPGRDVLDSVCIRIAQFFSEFVRELIAETVRQPFHNLHL